MVWECGTRGDRVKGGLEFVVNDVVRGDVDVDKLEGVRRMGTHQISGPTP